jgi:hypothetical protein
MSAGSDASNLGYGSVYPNSNVNAGFVNVDNSHYPGGFGSNEIPGLPGLAGAKSNVDAAASHVPGICLMKGGNRRFSHKNQSFKRKIKNITREYKMKGGKKSAKRTFLKISKKIRNDMKRAASRAMTISKMLARNSSFKGGKTRRLRKGKNVGRKSYHRGGSYTQSIPYPPGYSQYQNNLPLTPSYSVGGVLSANELGLANPPPYHVLGNAGDNYSHYPPPSGNSFASRGH